MYAREAENKRRLATTRQKKTRPNDYFPNSSKKKTDSQKEREHRKERATVCSQKERAAERRVNTCRRKLFWEMWSQLNEKIGKGPIGEIVRGLGPVGFLLTVLVSLFLGFLIGKRIAPKKSRKERINKEIKMDCAKVVDILPIEIEDLVECKDGKVVMCRCWKSKKFPYCDGSHTEHNSACGDNVGPLIIQKKK